MDSSTLAEGVISAQSEGIIDSAVLKDETHVPTEIAKKLQENAHFANPYVSSCSN
jgi:hypothetical protein